MRPFEATVREASVEVPDAARAVVVSLDGVLAPMRGADRYREAGLCDGLAGRCPGGAARERAHGADAANRTRRH